MADDEKESEPTSTRGADWEVVQLTASTYAAAPGPKELGPDNERSEQESSGAMFMSEHFVFPPYEHENLPIEHENLPIEHENLPIEPEIQSEPEIYYVNPVEEEGRGSGKTKEEITQNKYDDEPHGIQFFNNGNNISVLDMEFEEGKGLQELNLVGEGRSMYAAHEPNDPSHENPDSPKYANSDDEDKYDGPGLPCGAWWKRHATCLYRHAKEANTLWSVFVAASLMGLVILGKRWQQEKWHLQQHKWHINDERLNQMLGPIARFKNVLIGSRHHNPLINGAASART